MALHDPELRKLYDLKVCAQPASCGQSYRCAPLRFSCKPTRTLCLLDESPVMFRSEGETYLASSNSDHFVAVSDHYPLY